MCSTDFEGYEISLFTDLLGPYVFELIVITNWVWTTVCGSRSSTASLTAAQEARAGEDHWGIRTKFRSITIGSGKWINRSSHFQMSLEPC